MSIKQIVIVLGIISILNLVPDYLYQGNMPNAEIKSPYLIYNTLKVGEEKEELNWYTAPSQAKVILLDFESRSMIKIGNTNQLSLAKDLENCIDQTTEEKDLYLPDVINGCKEEISK